MKNPYKFFFPFFICQSILISTKCTVLVDESYRWCRTAPMWRRKDTFVFPPLAIWVWVCVFRLFFYSFFLFGFIKRFIYSNDNTTQYFVLVYYVFSVFFFFFLPFECSHLFSILVITTRQFLHTQKKTVILFQFLCPLCDKFIKRFVYLELELGEQFQ